MKTKSKLFTLASVALLGGCLFLSLPKAYANMPLKLAPSGLNCYDADGKIVSFGNQCVSSLVDGCIANGCPEGTSPTKPPAQ
ncbi:hypothetical protein KXD93_25670 [Mucilaginibacter sp. BJC16-A38]|uniref:hypothetical protein n=1 Tax=Mucilaginibacter phenanthrenivorans TaxID=1234842 RepID=UPI002158249B|nr:hypothetical protein [Mucilaginibacter phenanthrenivorans]MCR8561072.1 hypothetical protein [Mucilaginibacter phenanthrenivorans]